MKRLMGLLGFGMLIAALGVFAAAAIADNGNGNGDGYVPVTICHATPTGAGNSGPADKYELITPDNQGVFQGHQGHPNDIIPAPADGCPSVPPPADLCLNLEGVQTEVPGGYTRNENGRCVPTPPPPSDVCPNLEGVQSKLPDGMVLEDGKCVGPPPRLCPDGKPPTSGDDAYDPNDDCKRPPTPVTETTPTPTTADTPPTSATPPATTTTAPTTPAAPFTPPTTKPGAKKPAVTKPVAKPAPAPPKQAVAGAFAQEPPKLAYTP